MEPGLLALLRCPSDGGTLAHVDGALRCADGHAYDVCDGVPRLVPGVAGATAAAFAAKWRTSPPEDRRSLAAMQERWYDERFGWDGDAALGAHLRGCRRVLDAGSGL